MTGEPKRPTVPQTYLDKFNERTIIKPQELRQPSAWRELALWAMLSVSLTLLALVAWDGTPTQPQAATGQPCACCEGDDCTCKGGCSCRTRE